MTTATPTAADLVGLAAGNLAWLHMRVSASTVLADRDLADLRAMVDATSGIVESIRSAR